MQTCPSKFILIAFFIGGMLFLTSAAPAQKPEIIYVYDPLCGWCYGFSPVMQKIKEEYKDKADFKILSGGLAIGERVGSIKEKYGFIKEALPAAEKTTGIKFGQDFKNLLEEGSYVLNSEPPSVALTVVKEMKPEIAFDYAHRLQSVIFQNGKNLNDQETYLDLCREFNLNEVEFKKKFLNSSYKEKTFGEYKFVKELGVEGFPTVLLKRGDEIKVVCSGFRDFSKVNSILNKLLR